MSDPALDPVLTDRFAGRFKAGGDSSVVSDPALFYRLNQPEHSIELLSAAFDFIKRELVQAECSETGLMVTDFNRDNLLSLRPLPIKALADSFCTEGHERECVQQSAVVLMTQPAWLQAVMQNSSCQSRCTLQLMLVYLQLRGQGQDLIELSDLHEALLSGCGVRTPQLYTEDFAYHAPVLPEIRAFAIVQLALARFPRVFFPEITGFTLAYCQAPTLMEVCFPAHHQNRTFFQQRQFRVQQAVPALHRCIHDYLARFSHHQQPLWLRIQSGFRLFQWLMKRCRDRFEDILLQPPSVQQSAAVLLQHKAAAAIGHHQKIMLQDKTLDQWFAGMPENSQAFLRALRHSNYVDSQNPVASPLLKLFDFKGPMFGVLSQSEREVLLAWLKDGDDECRITVAEEVKMRKDAQCIKNKDSLVASDNRTLYYYLLNVDIFPDILPTARKKVQRQLKTCALFSRLPFRHYSHQRFERYISDCYHRETKAYRPLDGRPVFSREAYVWGLEQVAPMILIDGCWLLNSQRLHSVSPEISRILFSIYCDEIGNGELQQNHPFIFQQLLDSLSIQLPPAGSKEFSQHPGFINCAFDLPVFMLSLASFPQLFFPELLGLNMAIELSGLGKGYLQLVDDWKYWGIDPTIARIHISIDNAASGHTFLAKKAIRIYMDEILQRNGDCFILDQHWKRIYNGFASLRFIGARFKGALPVSYLIHQFKRHHWMQKRQDRSC